MGRRLLFLVGSVVIVLGSACSGDGGGAGGGAGGLLSSPETYEAEGYAVDYPEGWEVAEGGRIDNASDVELISPETDSPFPPHVRVTRMTDMAHFQDVDSVAVSVVAGLRPEVNDLDVSNQTETDVEGAESAVSVALSYSDDIEGTTADVRELVVVAVSGPESGEVTVVRFVAPADDYEDLEETFEGLAGGIRVE